jgi:hypothetical protein
MKAAFAVVIAAMIWSAPALHAQAATEYSAASTKSAGTGLSATGGAINRGMDKIAEKSADAGAAKPADTSTGPLMWEDKSRHDEKSTRGKQVRPEAQVAPAPPLPAAVFILSSGERLESTNYLLTADSVRVQQGGAQRTIPMSKLNVNATLAANHQRGVELKIPANKSQITLSF